MNELNNLGELFTEFKKYRNSKWKKVAKKENFYDYVGNGLGFFKVEKEIIKKRLFSFSIYKRWKGWGRDRINFKFA